ncbi:MAG: hypothetical protein U0744_02105 [Gemmataceae bacterium]
MSEPAKAKLRELVLAANRKADVETRARLAWLLAQTAKPEDIEVMRSWMKRETSNVVKKQLEEGINRIDWS